MEEKEGLGLGKKYFNELSDIEYELRLLKEGKIYEFTNNKFDGSLKTRASRLEESIVNLLYKIEHNIEGSAEMVAKIDYSGLNDILI